MFVPHTEKRIINVQISFFTLAGIVAALALVIGVFAFLSVTYGDTSRTLAAKVQDLKDTKNNLDQIRDEVTNLVKSYRNFETVLSQTLTKIGLKNTSASTDASGGDLASFYQVSETGLGSVREAGEISRIARYLDRTVEPLKEAGTWMEAQSAVLTEIPNLWPIKGGIGHISFYFGQNANPFYGSWFMHKGVDFSTFRTGDPIVATADGQVTYVGFDAGYGNAVVIEHKHGFTTRYAHMYSFAVIKGQKVAQGEVIGYIGSTGMSTGPHLHYEVHLGTGVIDPLRFLNIRSKNTLTDTK